MPVSHKHSNDWTQYPTTISDASSSLFSPHPSERSRLMLGNVYSSEVSLWHRGPLPVNYQRVTPTRGQFPIVFSFSRGTDWPNRNENLPSNKHQTEFSRFENVSVGNKTQAASPSLGVRPLAPPVRYPAVTTPDFHTNTRQFSSSTTSGSVAPVTSTKDEFSSHGQEGVGDFNMYRPFHGDTQANGGLTSTEMVYSERREESLRSHGPFNYQRGDSLASVSLRYPSLVPLEQQVAEIDRVPKEREERTKKQREAPQRHRDTRSRKQRESPQRHKDTRSRKQREVAQRNRNARSRKQREVAQRHTDTRSREQREVAQRHKDARSRKQREVAQRHKDARSRKQREVAQRHKDARSRKQREVAQRHRDTREKKQREETLPRFENVSVGNKTQAASERSRLMLENVYSRAKSLRHRGPLPVNYQPVTPTRWQFPSRGTDWPDRNENLPRNKHQTGWSRFENVSVGSETQPSPGVRSLAPPVRNSAVTIPSFGTSTIDLFCSHGQQRVGDFNRYWTTDGVVPALSGLPSSLQETPFWQCEHYQRHCTVKFSCCAMFYPCQHCHNLSGTCPANDKKARHATHVKCGNCGREEEVSIFCILGILS